MFVFFLPLCQCLVFLPFSCMYVCMYVCGFLSRNPYSLSSHAVLSIFTVIIKLATCYQLSVVSYQSYSANINFIIKTQSETPLDGKMLPYLLVYVTAEVMCLEIIFETRKSVTLSQLVW